ncbi:hypothetical protein OPQ81_003353 [Rhizoctonia solani]|nr:hypothetical protein OPQ81_003353 [Rhizoctonia solani]
MFLIPAAIVGRETDSDDALDDSGRFTPLGIHRFWFIDLIQTTEIPPHMASPPPPPPPPKRKRSIIADTFLHPGSLGKRPRSESPTGSRASTPGAIESHRDITSAHSFSPSPVLLSPDPSSAHRRQPAVVVANSTPVITVEPPASRNTNKTSWTGLEKALHMLHITTQIFPPLHSAIDNLKSFLHKFQAAKLRDDYDELATELTSLIELLAKHLAISVSGEISETIIRITGDLTKEMEPIEDIIQRYGRIHRLFRELQAEASMSTWSDTKKHLVNTQLENLGPIKLASFNSKISTDIGRRSCTENTRTQILNDSIAWADDPNGAKIYWMNGMAGTGKTTIAYSLCERLEAAGQLAASFFCTRTTRDCSEAKHIIPTISYQLARRSAPFRDSLCQVLDKDPDVGTLNITSQFQSLLAKPLIESRELMARNLVIVIDALDECSDPHTVKIVLDTLFLHAVDFSESSESDRPNSIIYLHEIEKSLVQADIELYLKDELKDMLPSHCADIEELAEQAGNLFIYAATAVRYIQPRGKAVNSRQRLKAILQVNNESKKSMNDIDILYSAVLSAAIHDTELEADEQENIQVALWTAICACEPVLIDTLATLSGFSDTDLAESALQPLRSVLHVSEHNSLVTTLHASFPDFMFSEERSKQFFCDRSNYDRILGRRCLEIMKRQLRFNICQLESSFILDDMISDLKVRVETRISQELSYASRYWVDHVTRSAFSNPLAEMVHEFLSQRLLFWMEVLNLKKCIVIGAVASTRIHMWLKTLGAPSSWISLARDAQVFVGKYASNPVSASTPHIYISALPLSSPSSLIRSSYWSRFKGLIQATGSLMEQTDQASLETWMIGSRIRGKIFVKNSHGGETIIDFKAHTQTISSVVFSNDGKLVASSSYDCTICVWDVSNGSCISGPLKGHHKKVNSVVFSPDGMDLVSGSEDNSVRKWSRLGHNPSENQVLNGHSKAVRSVAFSPDGVQIASGSDDHTIRIWNALTGEFIHDLKEHTQSISCVQFSPDGLFIFSGSNDCTIRIWDACDGKPSGHPLSGHTKRITSIAVSPEGDRIVSGSLDHTVMVWHRTSGELLAGPFKGHTGPVRSVEFSADGARVISASDDMTVRVWNAQGKTQFDAKKSPHSEISSIVDTTISGDGTYIACGHEDGSITVWNIQNGTREAAWRLQYVLAAYKDGVLRKLNVQTGKLAENPRRFSPPEKIANMPLALSSDGRSIVSTGVDRGIPLYLWNLQEQRLVLPIKAKPDIHSTFLGAVFSPEGTRLVTVTIDGMFNIWHGHTGEHVAGPFELGSDLGSSRSMGMGISPDGSCIIFRYPGEETQVYNLNRRTRATLSIPTDLEWDYVIFSPNKVYAAFIGKKVIGIYDHRQGRLLNELKPLPASSHFSKGGKFVTNESCVVPMWRFRGIFDIFALRLRVGVPGGYALRDGGWVSDGNSNKVIWVPPEIRGDFPVVNGSSLLGPNPITVDYDDMRIGDNWSECYIGE